ncbi:MAG: hypothetical protein ACI92G_004135 [Candidatus Pelagisphaera sp.]|jgi:hypothetical protein
MDESSTRESIISSSETAFAMGCHEISFPKSDETVNDLPLIVAYTLPSGAIKTSRGFATGNGFMKARCYVSEGGQWQWEAKNLAGRCIETGEFQAIDSPLPGKLRISKNDARQLQYDSGKWYLHFGDNAYRFLDPNETCWKPYIDQAAQAGFNRIRTQLDPSGNTLAKADGKSLNLQSWDAIEERLVYALKRHPEIQFELILFGEDTEALLKFGDGNPLSHLTLRYAIERFAALPNVHWSIANKLSLDDENLQSALNMAGESLYENDPWNSLITVAGKRFDSPPAAEAKWQSILSLSSLGQVIGDSILSERAKISKPILLVEDRGEHHHAPRFPRYFFRRLFWGAFLSGGMPSYRGLNTDSISDRNYNGIEGYYDSCNGGHLRYGAHDLLKIKQFFSDTKISLENWKPNDTLSGQNPLLVKSMISNDATQCIAYIANPESYAAHSPNGYEGMHSDQVSNTSQTFTTFTLELPFSSGKFSWFNPSTGEWNGSAEITKNSTTLLTPTPGDWVVWVQRG